MQRRYAAVAALSLGAPGGAAGDEARGASPAAVFRLGLDVLLPRAAQLRESRLSQRSGRPMPTQLHSIRAPRGFAPRGPADRGSLRRICSLPQP